ncbi:MAG: pilus assembly protein PilM [Thermoguttaceae bacterium]|nr:pilus assembly protein PilM [Thermoguttaceae bacterium]MDW8078242.1 pilus assembly protein PilM [Thermoguttaceae bacterium]
MPKSEAVWCLDVGNASLKALRCAPGDRIDQIRVEAFDYIEYPKLLTQPGAEVAEILNDALKQLISRNNLRRQRVAISVPGQSGLARFIKLPPVEAKRIPDIVRYEARQQIPFALDEVVWSYQRMRGGVEEEGFVAEAEIGLFAMKRDQVYRALQPLAAVGIEAEIVQLSPLALYNFLIFERWDELPSDAEYDPDNPPPYYVILSMGTDASDLVITNGFRVWQRSVPLGGNHFTRALTKELKLTFAKAEHIKRNTSAAEDPRAVFQAMRPVFNDLLTELHRSINYFSSINRTAEIRYFVPLGNAMKLPGLKRYLSTSLGYELIDISSFRGLVGPEVVQSPTFQENILTFAVCYGLAVQALGKGRIETNLLPPEVIRDRLIRSKKPWAVAAAAALLLGFSLSFVGYSRALGIMSPERYADAEQQAAQVVKQSQSLQQEKSAAESEYQATDQVGQNLVSHVEGRLEWLELLRAINECLPRDPEDQKPQEIERRNELHIVNIESQYMQDLSQWFALVQQWYQPVGASGSPGSSAAGSTAPAAPGIMPTSMNPAETGLPSGFGATPAAGTSVQGPSGPGYVIQLTGYHYHNMPTAGAIQGAQYVRETLIRNLQTGRVLLPKVDEPGVEWVTMEELGIGFPVLINPGRPYEVRVRPPTARFASGMGAGMFGPGYAETYSGETMGAYPGAAPMGPTYPGSVAPGARPGTPQRPEDLEIVLRRFDFVVQFCWQPVSARERHEKRRQKEAEQAAAAATAEQAPGAAAVSTPGGEAPPSGAQAQGPPAPPPGGPTATTPPPGTPSAAPAAPSVSPGGAPTPPGAQAAPVPAPPGPAPVPPATPGGAGPATPQGAGTAQAQPAAAAAPAAQPPAPPAGPTPPAGQP